MACGQSRREWCKRVPHFIWLTLIVAGSVAFGGEESNEAAAAVWGKYPNSLLLRTRTAATYPEGLTVFTLVGVYQDFTERRNANTGDMEGLPAGMERKQYTGVLWSEYGITDQFQVGVSVPLLHRAFRDDANGIDDSATGLGDISLYAKCKVVQETRLCPAMTVDGFLKLPTGKKANGLGNGEMDATLAGSLSKRFGFLSFHLNPEYTFTGGDQSSVGAAADDRIRLNCGVMWHATPWLLPSLEWNGMWWGDVGDQQEVGGGILWFPTKNTSVKLGVAVPVETDLPWATDWTGWLKIATWF